jgi:hypothetical protein
LISFAGWRERDVICGVIFFFEQKTKKAFTGWRRRRKCGPM